MDMDFEPDTFGHNIAVPDICAAGGVKYYYHCRGNGGEDNLYRWVGRGGGELLVWREAHWYNTTIEPNMFWDTPILCEKAKVPCILNVYGVGDHGGGPTRRDINRLLDMASWPIMPTILFSTYHAFFEEVEAYRHLLPVIEGELNFLFDGCYTSQAKIKMANRLGETRAYESEVLDTQAYMASGQSAGEAFAEAWHGILFNQFHDILPGSGVPHTREHALGRFQDSMAYLTTAGNAAMRRIAAEINTTDYALQIDPQSISEGGGVGKGVATENYYRMPFTDRGSGKLRLLHFFNPTQYDFDGITEFFMYDWNYNLGLAEFKDTDGNVAPHKVLEVGTWYWGHNFNKFALRVKIPAFGYASYTLDTRPAGAPGLPPLFAERTDDYTGDDIILENTLVRAIFDHRTAELKSFVEKSSGKELIAAPACTFNLITENTIRHMTSWRVGDYMNIRPLNRTCDLRVHDIRCDGIRKWFRYDFSFSDRSRMEVLVTLDDNSSCLDFDVSVDFHEIGNHSKGVPQLSFALPLGYTSSVCRFDVPFGTIDRAPLDYDVPASSFGVPVSEDGASLMLISDSKYGFRYTNGQLSLALIRASFDPDPYPEYGIHKIRLGVGICHPESGNKDLYRLSEHFVHPMSYCTADLQKREGPLSADGRFLTVEGNVKVTALKKAEDAAAVVVRLSNIESTPTDCQLRFMSPVKAAYLASISETPTAPLPVDGMSVMARLSGHELATVLVEFA